MKTLKERPQRSKYPTREAWVGAILDSETDIESSLAVACRRFLTARANYQAGQGDVIFGLQHLDELEREIKDLL